MNSLAGRSYETARSRDSIIAERQRQLRKWAYRRCVLCFVIVFPFAIAITHPPFGMGGPNFVRATLFTLAVVAVNGMIMALRIPWELFRVDAQLAGSTRPYLLGRRVARVLRMAAR